MRDLQEVRRYWPRARMSGQLLCDGAVVLTVYTVGRRGRVRIGVYADGTAMVDGRVSPTIPEAMRAAGFGVRPLGEYASRLKSSRTVVYKRGTYVVIATVDWQPMCVDRQRPRKGARLGRRKKEAKP